MKEVDELTYWTEKGEVAKVPKCYGNDYAFLLRINCDNCPVHYGCGQLVVDGTDDARLNGMN